jgi:Arc/MetJ-type ribon-helix-helix transcriptional regulator
MTALTIRIPEKLSKQLRRLCREQERSASEVVRESLRRYLAMEELEQLRRKLRPYAEAQGIFTDEDVFKAVS